MALALNPRIRLAAWAVCVAGTPMNSLDSQLIAGAPLPGLIQSAYPAEVTAIWHALQWANQRRCRVCVWSDCQAAVNMVRKLLEGHEVPPTHPHYDLWSRVQGLLEHFPEGRVRIRKVTSHAAALEAEDEIQAWAFWHNALVDRAAGEINRRRPPAMWQLWQQVVTDRNALRQQRYCVDSCHGQAGVPANSSSRPGS